MVDQAREDIIAFRHFPQWHLKKIWSTNPLERVNKEIKRSTNVVGVFPNPASRLRLAGAILIEQHDERDLSERQYLAETTMKLIDPNPDETTTPALTTA